ncbi:hypothetical protein [Limosilactobacillus fermentum]|uniref:hypothetical protein n=1 Tax=Limosilactobacillus fermentum TaxID=1613 RepID=UPI00280BB8DC|nr:hypothetical protein [Limosilactobacillus fermentum]
MSEWIQGNEWSNKKATETGGGVRLPGIALAEGFVNLVVKLELVKLTIPLVSNVELMFAVGNLKLFIAFICLATPFINFVTVTAFYPLLLYVSIQFSISLQLGELPGARGI